MPNRRDESAFKDMDYDASDFLFFNLAIPIPRYPNVIVINGLIQLKKQYGAYKRTSTPRTPL